MSSTTILSVWHFNITFNKSPVSARLDYSNTTIIRIEMSQL